MGNALIDNLEFVSDMCRFAENILSEAAVRKKYRFDETTWSRLGEDDELVRAIEEEKTRRIRSGTAKREKAQQHVVAAPDILNSIMTDPRANAKHKVDAIKTLDSLADPGPQAAADQDRVVVTINLGGDVLRFDKAVKPTPPNDPKVIEHDSSTPGLPGFAV
jgi:hypothetical protein